MVEMCDLFEAEVEKDQKESEVVVVEEWWLAVEVKLKWEASSRIVEEEEKGREEYMVEEEREDNIFDMLLM